MVKQVKNFVDYSRLRTELEDTSWTKESNESAGTPIGNESSIYSIVPLIHQLTPMGFIPLGASTGTYTTLESQGF